METKTFRTAPFRRAASLLAVSLGLAVSASARNADDAPATPPLTAAAGQPSHSPSGKPARKSARWYQVGIASWYGSYFQGRTTANGEQFDMNRMTCAHPTLPMGTWLRVTNLRNRHSTFVRVNDRGPVTEGRIVDLSAAAARVLGLAGIGKVRIEAVRESDPELTMALVANLRTPSLLQPVNQ